MHIKDTLRKLYMCEILVPIALTSLNINMSEKFENINGKKQRQ
jgi:hypothetical protein